MNKLITAALLAFAALTVTGCGSYITSAQPGSTVATGEAWYTRDNYFIFYLGTDIYYCPAGSATCYQAEMK